MLCTNDRTLYHHLLMLRSHGWLKDLPSADTRRIMRKHGFDPFHFPFTFLLPGFNLRPTDISAKTGQIQLHKLDETIRIRVENHRLYQQLLKGIVAYAPGLPGDVISSISFCAVASSAAKRKRIVMALEPELIDTRIFTAGKSGRHPFWTRLYGRFFFAPVADKLFRGGFFLPNNQSLQKADIEYICDVVARAVGK